MTEGKFLELVHEHKARVYQHTLYLLGNREDAEDITQETFITAWKHRNTLRPKTARSWVAKVCAESQFQSAKTRQVSGAFNRRRRCRSRNRTRNFDAHAFGSVESIAG